MQAPVADGVGHWAAPPHLLLPRCYAELPLEWPPEVLKIQTPCKASHGEKISGRQENRASQGETRKGKIVGTGEQEILSFAYPEKYAVESRSIKM